LRIVAGCGVGRGSPLLTESGYLKPACCGSAEKIGLALSSVGGRASQNGRVSGRSLTGDGLAEAAPGARQAAPTGQAPRLHQRPAQATAASGLVNRAMAGG